MHKATHKLSPLQNRLGIIATGCAFDAGDGNKKNREAASPEVKGGWKPSMIEKCYYPPPLAHIYVTQDRCAGWGG
jgi:hypothetical protein